MNLTYIAFNRCQDECRKMSLKELVGTWNVLTYQTCGIVIGDGTFQDRYELVRLELERRGVYAEAGKMLKAR